MPSMPASTWPGIGNPVELCFVGMPNTHNIFAYLRTRGPASFGIRAGLPVGNPYYWSMLSLAVVKNILKLKGFVKTLDRILFTPYLDTLMLPLTLFDLKGFTTYLDFKP